MVEVRRLAIGVAPTSTTVMLLGEPGTGKQLVARAIHESSARRSQPFVAVDVSAIPADLVASELFGHERGAFTGAATSREGLFTAAAQGTLLLQNVEDLPPLAQVKLLRVLLEGSVTPLGSTDVRQLDVRVIVATTVDLRERVREHLFREDLYYRLNVIQIRLPALRDRGNDIELLARHIGASLARRFGRSISRISGTALERLRAYSWPGNVRELTTVIEHAVALGSGEEIGLSDLPDLASSPSTPREEPGAESTGVAQVDPLHLYFDLDALGPADIADILQLLAKHFGGSLTTVPPHRLPPGEDVFASAPPLRRVV
jgi:DNA-binding NtrC family response regulator